MNEQNASHKVVLTAALLTFGLGWFNAKRSNKAPSRKFLVGSAVTFLALSFLSDFSPAAANALALAVATTALFSEGNGILSYLNDGGELNTPTKEEERNSQDPKKTTVKKHAPESIGQIPGL